MKTYKCTHKVFKILGLHPVCSVWSFALGRQNSDAQQSVTALKISLSALIHSYQRGDFTYSSFATKLCSACTFWAWMCLVSNADLAYICKFSWSQHLLIKLWQVPRLSFLFNFSSHEKHILSVVKFCPKAKLLQEKETNELFLWLILAAAAQHANDAAVWSSKLLSLA